MSLERKDIVLCSSERLLQQSRAQLHLIGVNLENITPADWAYAAGFVEGDGSLGLYRRSVTRREKDTWLGLSSWVSVHNTELVILEWFKSKFGGCIAHYKCRANNTRFKGRKPVWAWALPPSCHGAFCEAILPYLKGVKEKKARLVIAFRKVVPAHRKGNKPKQDALYEAYLALG